TGPRDDALRRRRRDERRGGKRARRRRQAIRRADTSFQAGRERRRNFPGGPRNAEEGHRRRQTSSLTRMEGNTRSNGEVVTLARELVRAARDAAGNPLP